MAGVAAGAGVPSVDVVIVNWNAGAMLAACLGSLFAAASETLALRRVVVVDNGSSDGSAAAIADTDPRLRLILNGENRGFAAACNQGASGSTADYLLFLNPDTRLFRDSLMIPVAFMERPENSGTGICGIQMVDDSGRPARSSARFPTPRSQLHHLLGLDRLFPARFPGHFMAEWDHAGSRRVDHVIGAFFLVRRALFEKLGGFDERFFLYWEDLDFSLRARQAGHASQYLTEARVWHKGGGTSGRIRARRLFYSLHSRLLFVRKHFGRADATRVAFGTLCIEPVIRLLHAVLRLSPRQAGETIAGYAMLYRALLAAPPAGKKAPPR